MLIPRPRILCVVLLGLMALVFGACNAPTTPRVPEAQVKTPLTIAAPVLVLDQSSTPEDVGALLQPVIAKAGIPGMSVIVLRGDRIIARGVAGVRRKGGVETITFEDQFEICSGSKAMTASLVALLAEDAKLDWDAPLTRLFSEPGLDIDPAWKAATLRQVLAHRAGVRDHIPAFLASTYFDKGDRMAKRRNLALKVLLSPPESQPDTKFVYSNADYILVAAAIEMTMGRSWEELMQERVFAPLGITSAGIGPPGTPGTTDQPWGHGKRRIINLDLIGSGDTPFDPGSSSADYPLELAPVGLVHMTMPDWAKFVAWHLRADRANPQHKGVLLSEDSFLKLHEAAAGVECVGGWMVGTRPWAKGHRTGDTGRVLFHAGDNGRWNSVVWVAPEIDFAILIACNRTHTWSAVDEVAGKILHRFVDRK